MVENGVSSNGRYGGGTTLLVCCNKTRDVAVQIGAPEQLDERSKPISSVE
eukprot:CAMPEP_0175986308 /NCGR_PEP_ID=MMETSP0108-20121206/50075_1 /TAXON_ID=195067 ORGANISM="Goniomonas pacifica, Strain CCMP1869" /NCGR_SAMPLE_ID=MMETSP0108 /ASSEMBLY_ACC=CAM_ASM_000204 /LENGTH=49 /DNA_ID= /DNA_START= /DNA_END= /DNA_ORIENTATION=